MQYLPRGTRRCWRHRLRRDDNCTPAGQDRTRHEQSHFRTRCGSAFYLPDESIYCKSFLDRLRPGNIKRHRAFHSKVLGNRRDVLVYLPPGYRRFSSRRYPVLYLHDGQNVFDAATSFAGIEWGVDETAQRLIHRKLIEPLIIVAVANIGEERIHEYAPTPGVIEPKDHPRKHSRGLARIYGQFLIEELKPFIDKKYRTKREAEFTGLGGSSLGGLATLAMGILYSEVFTRLIAMSPSIWWDDYAIFRLVGILGEKIGRASCRERV